MIDIYLVKYYLIIVMNEDKSNIMPKWYILINNKEIITLVDCTLSELRELACKHIDKLKEIDQKYEGIDISDTVSNWINQLISDSEDITDFGEKGPYWCSVINGIAYGEVNYGLNELPAPVTQLPCNYRCSHCGEKWLYDDDICPDYEVEVINSLCRNCCECHTKS